jgi:hypothetical protein
MGAEGTTKPSGDAIYWFARLELALDKGDWAAAAHAQQELRRLGVEVRHTRPAARQEIAHVQ